MSSQDRHSSLWILESDGSCVVLHLNKHREGTSISPISPTHPLRVVELLVRSDPSHASVVNTPVKVASQHVRHVVRLTPGGEQLAVPQTVQLAGVEAHLLPSRGRSLQ